MVTPVHRQLNRSLNPLKAAMDPAALEICEDLIRKMYPFELIRPIRDIPEGVTELKQFNSQAGHLITMHMPDSIKDFEEELGASHKHNQFLTHEENKLYCMGTSGLLELLTKYSNHRTEKAIIIAHPEATTFKGADGAEPQAYFDQDCLAHYGETRRVSVVIIVETGFVAFNYVQDLSPEMKREVERLSLLAEEEA